VRYFKNTFVRNVRKINDGKVNYRINEYHPKSVKEKVIVALTVAVDCVVNEKKAFFGNAVNLVDFGNFETVALIVLKKSGRGTHKNEKGEEEKHV